MNISKNTIDLLSEVYNISFNDDFSNTVSFEKATLLSIGFSKTGEYIGKSIKGTKKEISLEYILGKINTDTTFKNFATYFNSIVSKYGLNAYPTSYGIGIFVAFGYRCSISETKEQIDGILRELGLEYHTELSDAGWVFRYKISKSLKNIDLIEKIIIS